MDFGSVVPRVKICAGDIFTKRVVNSSFSITKVVHFHPPAKPYTQNYTTESMTTDAHDLDAGRSDRDEMAEVVKAFLNQYRGATAGATKTRIQKMVFFGDIYCLQNFGYRLTNADFMTYDHGAYSRTLEDVVNDSESIETFDSPYSRNPQYRATEPARISDEKAELVEHIFQKIVNRDTEDLAHLSKQTWLYKNTTHGDVMDFDRYRDDVMISPVIYRELDIEEPSEVNSKTGSVADIVNE